jgi:hypothetical protein
MWRAAVLLTPWEDPEKLAFLHLFDDISVTPSVPIEGSQIVAAMTPPTSKAAFNRGQPLVRASDGTLLHVHAYTSERRAEGAVLSEQDLQVLVETGHATALRVPIPAALGASLWVLRRRLPLRDGALSELRMSGLLIHSPLDGPDYAELCMVDEGRPEASAMLDRWRDEAMARAKAHAQRGEWDFAELHGEVANAVGRRLDPEVLGFLSLVYEHRGRTERAEGILVMARRSRGEDFEAQVIRAREHFRRTLSVAGQSARDRLLAYLHATLLDRYPKLAPDLGQSSSPRLAA